MKAFLRWLRHPWVSIRFQRTRFVKRFRITSYYPPEDHPEEFAKEVKWARSKAFRELLLELEFLGYLRIIKDPSNFSDYDEMIVLEF